MQPDEENVAFDLQTRRNGRSRTDRDAADPRDRTIAELKGQVALLRRELGRRDDVLMFLAGMVGSSSGAASEAVEEAPGIPPEAPQRSAPGPRVVRKKVREEEKPEWPPLPEGYRVVATASDARVLVARGKRVAGYRGTLDPEEATRDAWEHHRRKR